LIVSERDAVAWNENEIADLTAKVGALRASMARVIIGQDEVVESLIICLLAGGHALVEGVPGLGKTLLVKSLAQATDMQFRRVQFTPDLMPSDIVGTEILEEDQVTRQRVFRFQQGPVFTQVLLADEINRATPKTQSGLLEAMEERQVTADGVTRPLPEPFFVIATQNPAHQVGTFPLPESQLDRFLMCLSLGYPDASAERALLMGEDRRAMLKTLQPVMRPEELLDAQRSLRAIHASGALIDYLQALALESRSGKLFAEGLSPRAVLALLQAGRAWAALEGRDHVIPEDIQTLLVPVCAHRLRPMKSALGSGGASRDLVLQLQKSVPV
jgi:MoxR-like ATPase